MIKKASIVCVIGLPVALAGFFSLKHNLPTGPIILIIASIPIFGLFIVKQPLKSAIPDLIFGAIDTGLLTIPALWGGINFGAAGAIAGGVIGDALTDAIAGFFEGSISEWLRSKGIEESREAVTTSLGKMSGCLFGSGIGIVLTTSLILGIKP